MPKDEKEWLLAEINHPWEFRMGRVIGNDRQQVDNKPMKGHQQPLRI